MNDLILSEIQMACDPRISDAALALVTDAITFSHDRTIAAIGSVSPDVVRIDTTPEQIVKQFLEQERPDAP